MEAFLRFAPGAAFYLLALGAQVSGWTNQTVAVALFAIGTLLLLIAGWKQLPASLKGLPRFGLLPFGEAARRAYEETRHTEAGRIAEKLNEEDVLGYFRQALKDHRGAKFYGTHPPSQKMEPIAAEDLEHGTFSDDGSYTESYKNKPKYEKLHLRRSDLYSYIRRMKEMKVEVPGAPARKSVVAREGEWPALTARQSRKLVELLRNEPRHTIYLACQYPGSAKLAKSFQAAFQELQWPLIVGDGGIDG